jgi:phosphonate transport system permease protein
VSAVLGAVGAGGIGDLVVQNLRFREWGVAGLGFIVMVLATVGVDVVSGAIRRRILAGPAARTERDITSAEGSQLLADSMPGGIAG